MGTYAFGGYTASEGQRVGLAKRSVPTPIVAGGAEAALPALRVGQGVDRDDRNLGDGADHQLGDAVAAADRNGSLPWLIRITISSPR